MKREEAIDELSVVYERLSHPEDCENGCYSFCDGDYLEAIGMAIEALSSDSVSREMYDTVCEEYNKLIHQLSAETSTNTSTNTSIGSWIPCSERLPERTDKYLVTVANGNVYAGTFSTFDNRFTCKAVAWMELPEPYRGE